MSLDENRLGGDSERCRLQDHQFVFVGGLHKSGTSLVARCLAEHPLISGFWQTGVPEDEGQHLQTVFPPAGGYGGAGKFAFHPEAHLTETSELVTEDNRVRLLAEWGRHWDLAKLVLLEKSPPNLLRTRFLQALFPRAYFIVLIRHPIAVAYATQKWSRTPVGSLIEHWLVAHERFEQDRPYVHRLQVVRYEDLVDQPQPTLDGIFTFLGLPSHRPEVAMRRDANAAYLERWREFANSSSPGDSSDARRITLTYGSRVEAFGYQLSAEEPAGDLYPRAGERAPGVL